MAVEYMTREESIAYRAHVQHGKQALAVAVTLALFVAAALLGSGLEMSHYLWAGVALAIACLGITLTFFGLAAGVTRDNEE